jgi:uncharacterized membrane protein
LIALLVQAYAGGAHTSLTAALAPGGLEGYVLRSPAEVVAALGQRDPDGLIDLGLFVLMATPLASVILSGIQFWLEGDRRLVAVVAVVLSVITLSFFLGTTT